MLIGLLNTLLSVLHTRILSLRNHISIGKGSVVFFRTVIACKAISYKNMGGGENRK